MLTVTMTQGVVAARGAFGQRHGISAAIFGMGGRDETSDRSLPPPPPRPPYSQPSQHRQEQMPPPPPRTDRPSKVAVNATRTPPQMPPPPPNDSRDNGRSTPPPIPQPPQRWGMPPPQGSHQQAFWDPSPQGSLPPPEALFYDLDQSLQREAFLVQQVNNLSSTVGLLEQREELHSRQMDVLTERIVEIEAVKASRETRLVEVEANCTTLQKEIATMKGEIKEYEARCSDFVQRIEGLESEKHDLSKRFKLAQRNAENLAALIETHRLEEGKERRTAKKKKSRGFFAWLFGFGSEDDDDLDELRDTARSTLLQALQNERGNVEELENALTTLQNNNSAIAQQVESRDAIIDELNSRIAVFEEDKVVLKAALKQLQIEMKQEEPKTARLKADLEDKQKEIIRLKKLLDVLRVEHRNNTAKLQSIIGTKDRLLNQSKANLTMIGTYVDKLEERLADFAVARRDINERSKKIDELEDEIESLSSEKKALLEKLSATQDDREQIKELLEDLSNERSRLLSENQRLQSHQNDTQAEVQRLVASIQSANHELARMQNMTKYWESSARDLASQLHQKASEYDLLEERKHSMDNATFSMRERLEELEQNQEEWKKKLANAENAREELMKKLREVVATRVESDDRIALLQHNLTVVKERHKEDLERLHEVLDANQKLKEVLQQSRSREESMQIEMEQKVKRLEEEASERQRTFQQQLILARTENSKKNGIKADQNSSLKDHGTKTMDYVAGDNVVGKVASGHSTKGNVSIRFNKTRVDGVLQTDRTRQSRPGSVLRPVRKFFASATGLHGFFSKKQNSPRKGRMPVMRSFNRTLLSNATNPKQKLSKDVAHRAEHSDNAPLPEGPQQRAPPGPGMILSNAESSRNASLTRQKLLFRDEQSLSPQGSEARSPPYRGQPSTRSPQSAPNHHAARSTPSSMMPSPPKRKFGGTPPAE
jgi:DNA repair exonuclease SbcCD ATPase subunit